MGIALRLFFFVLVAPFISAWSLMITIGIVHAHISAVVSPVSYGPCLGIAYLTCLVASLFALVNVAGAALSVAEMY